MKKVSRDKSLISKVSSIVSKLPSSSGVYLFKDKAGKIIYIGKAANLRKRVSGYFFKNVFKKNIDTFDCAKSWSLVRGVEWVEYIVTNSEIEALVLESNLIKEYQPRYNVQLKDDKEYPYLEITKEEFPRLRITRAPAPAGLVWGPYTDVKSLRRAVKIIREVFCLRSCNYDFRKKRLSRACLYYDLKRCSGPCAGHITGKDYNKTVRQASLFLEGKNKILRIEVEREMKRASFLRDYEKAGELRDRLRAIDKVLKVGEIYYTMKKLKALLNLPALPYRVEGIDVSHISGNEATGVITVFENGIPKPDGYRRFRIKFSPTKDDCAMISEIVDRRYRRLLEKEIIKPDLILVDGGKGQVGSAVKKLEELGLNDIPVAGIAKRFERIYIPQSKTAIAIGPAQKGTVLNFLKSVRDEAHRFAQKYHHLLRKKKIFLQ